jgi:pheromone a factor receptor
MKEGPSFPVYPLAVVVSTLSLLAIILDIPPFLWHLRNRNAAAASVVFWILIMNVTVFVNALIWPTDDIENWFSGVGLCDIEVKLFVGATGAVPGALVCIMRGLAKVLDTENSVVASSRGARRRQMIIDSLLCVGVPVYLMAVHYVVQHIRFYVWGISGCNTPYDETWLPVALVFIWPPIITLFSAYFAGKRTTQQSRFVCGDSLR